jgi:hypothetical protein
LNRVLTPNGKPGPFQGAIALTVLALLMILSWNENYGETNDHINTSLYQQFSLGWNTTLGNSSIWKIGLTQALSEGAMYTVSFNRFAACHPISACASHGSFATTVCLHVGANSSFS